MSTSAQSELPLVAHLNGISQLKRCAEDMKAALDKESETLSKITTLYPSLPYLLTQRTTLGRVLADLEEMWDLSFSEIYALKPESCARVVQDVVARYEHNALRCPLDPPEVDDLAWLQ